MKKLTIIIFIIVIAYAVYEHYTTGPQKAPSSEIAQDNSILSNAYKNHLSNIQVHSQGIVAKVLPDDNEGSRHQRFIIRLSSGQSLLIAYNIDIAPRINDVIEGDTIGFSGEYEWNSKGGVIHWTHHDPEGRHPAGWIKHKGKMFQ
jgi:hypothetical protein